MGDSEEQPSGLNTKLHQISGPELAELEELLPDLLWHRPDLLTPRVKIKWRRVMEILQNVRWNGGPPLKCFRIPADGDPPEDDLE